MWLRVPADLHVESCNEVGALEAFVDERSHHREEKRHQQRRRTSFASDIAECQQHAAIGKWNDVVEVSTDCVGGSRHPKGFDTRCLESRAWQHRLLNLSRDLQIVLQRESVCHFQQDKQVHQQERRQQPERTGRECRMWNEQEVHLTKQLHQPDETGNQRNAVDQSAGGCELQREAEKQQPRVSQHPTMPALFLQLVEIDVPRKKLVGLECVPREKALDIRLGETSRVGVKKRAASLPGQWGDFHGVRRDLRSGVRRLFQIIPSSAPTFRKISRANWSSASVCEAVTIVRTLALSRATVGKVMPCANTPSSKSRSESRMARALSPTMTGVMGLSLVPVLKPSACRPALKNLVFCQSFSIHCGSVSRTSIAARQVAT